MKTFLIFSFTLISYLVSAQYGRLGFTESQIREEFGKYGIQKKSTDYGMYLTCEIKFGIVTWVFNNSNTCTWTMFHPFTTEYLNFFVKQNNDSYTIVSDTEWRYYTPKGIWIIELIYTDETYFFSTHP